MPLSLYRRASGVYHIRGTHCGYRVDRSARTRDRATAKLIAAKWEAELLERYIRGDKAVTTFAEAAAGYLRGGGDQTGMTALLTAFGTRRMESIGQEDLDALAFALYPDAKPSSRLRLVYTPFCAVWNWAVRARKAEPRLWQKPSASPGRTDWRTPEEIERLLAACSGDLARLVTFYVGVGARASEALHLEWRDVTPAAHRVVLWETKAEYSRHVDLCDRVRFALPQRSDGLVFTRWSDARNVNQALERACRRAGIRHLSCHVLRHTWATWAYAVTRDMPRLMQQGGWRSADMVMRYVHAASSDLAEVVLTHGWEFGGKPGAGSSEMPPQSKGSRT